MNNNKNIYQEKLRVNYSDVGPNGLITPVSILNICQDIASRHCKVLGITAIDLLSNNKTWMIKNYNLKFNSLPSWDSELTIETIRAPLKKLYETRCFIFRDEKENKIIEVHCIWILVDINTGRPARLDKNLDKELLENHSLIDFNFENIPLPDRESKSSFYMVNNLDIDFNMHANNSCYLKWGLESLPLDTILNKEIKSIDISFNNQSRQGDKIEVKTSGEKPFIQGIYSVGEKKLLASLKILTS